MENIEIIKALIEFQSRVPSLELNSNVSVRLKTGGQYNFKYADLPYIIDIIQPTLSKCRLGVYYTISDLVISIIVAHESGQMITSSLPISISNNPQEAGSLITYYKRYLLTSILNLVADEDDDANVNAKNDFAKSEIKKWLTDAQFKQAITSDAKGIEATLKAFDGSKEASMKKEYKTQLSNKLKELQNGSKQ